MRKLLFALLFSSAVSAHPQASSTNASVAAPPEIVVVTGSFEPLPLSETNRSVSFFDTGAEPELYTSLVDYLHLDSSLDLQERGTSGVQADLSIRGSSFGQTLVLVDGMRINDAQSGHHNLDLPFPLQAISRIEILHGAGSTLYGADAVGGAVNFVTAQPPLTTVQVRTAAGNFGLNQQDMLGAVSARSISECFSASRELSTGFEPDRDYRTLAVSSDTWVPWRLGLGSVLLASSDKAFGADQFYGNFRSWERTKGWLVAANQQIGVKTAISFGYRRHSDEFILVRGQPAIYENNHVSQSWQLAVRRANSIRKTLTIAYGIEGNGDQIDSNNLGRHSRNRGGAYLNLDLMYWQRIAMSLGIREELFTGGHIESSPTVAAGVWVRSNLKVRGSVSRAFRLPTYTDLYYRDPANVGNSFLRPEQAWGIEVGPEWTPTRHLSLKTNFFHRHDRDDIDYVKSVPTDPWQAMNVQRIFFDGVETGIRIATVNRMHALEAAYTIIHASQQPFPGDSKYVFNYPYHQAILSWLDRPFDSISLRSRLAVVQRVGYNPYVIWDLATGVNSGKIRPFVQLTNISDSHYEEIRGVAMPGRGIVGGFEIVWQRAKP
jgi:outer membrane cobalamin receptor